MSHTVVRGPPTASQLHLDSILDEIILNLDDHIFRNKFKKRNEVNLAEIIYYCMKKHTDNVFMINGSNGDQVTNGQILKYAIPLARAIQSLNINDNKIIIMMKNSQHMACLYYAAIFAGVVALMIDANSTVYEIRHFIDLVCPQIIFCDRDRLNDLKLSIEDYQSNIMLVSADGTRCLENFFEGHADHVNIFQISDAFPSSTAILLPTSGSSGLPKATILSHSGLIAQLPVLWMHHACFPKPTKMAMLLSSAQWMTHTILMTTCPVFGVTLLMTAEKLTTEHVLSMIVTFQPTWTLLGPTLAQSIAQKASTRQLHSLKTVVTTGAPLTQTIANILKEKLAKCSYFGSGVGMTETHGFFTMPGPRTAWDSNNKVVNTWVYKLVDEDGKDLGLNENGELLLKSSSSMFMGYYKNSEESRNAVTSDGWLLTGDIFFIDEMDELHYIERKKFWFKYLNYHISPLELETVINSVAGVQECVVCESKKGPVAAVVLKPGFSTDIEKEIHEVINTTFSNHKRLRGGIVFVSALPYTHSGKIKRAECSTLIQNCISDEDMNCTSSSS